MAETSGAVGDLLRRMRTEKGRSLRGAAEDLGVDPSYLSKVERGQKPLPESLRRRVTDYYEADDEQLLVANGGVPADIARILAEHPEALGELRRRYGQ
jgi:HTH-type transcriptional regulator, competence development regulator